MSYWIRYLMRRFIRLQRNSMDMMVKRRYPHLRKWVSTSFTERNHRWKQVCSMSFEWINEIVAGTELILVWQGWNDPSGVRMAQVGWNGPNVLGMYLMYLFKARAVRNSYCICDNEAVYKNASMPKSQLRKKHNSILYHMSREAVAIGACRVAK